MSRQCKAVLTATTLLLVISLSSFAHHGTNISYDQSKPITLTGTVVDFRYTNPHPQLYFDVTDASGKITRWASEIAPTPFTLQQAGWGKAKATAALKPGTKITITLGPSRVGAPVGLCLKIVNEKGEEILVTRAVD